ncbi:hypothetical protein RM150_22265 (plasmid) [Pantoea agglomerans]|uniref:hypothetical protein n=1 Tax=Enterobacter agglomerans TaxID=549 RepID=UPI00289BC386|nr:hypothetical protein [Pantoea agglomerans]WNK46983.1 hypothetical protein RM150_22265 [Pantoea agglomerans]
MDLEKVLAGLTLPSQFLHHDVSLTFEIITSLNAQTDASVEANINKYRSEGPEVEEHEISAEDDAYYYMEYYQGLDSGSVDLDDMFMSYYPSVTRRSVFLTLYGMLEHDYEKLCNGFARVHKVPVKLSDLKGSGFERCDLYAKKIIGMPTSPHYAMVKKVTKLRNACAHNDARFVGNDDTPITELKDLMRTFPALLVEDGKQVNFKAGSLQAMTSILKNYFNDVEEALKAHKAPDPFIAFRK